MLPLLLKGPTAIVAPYVNTPLLSTRNVPKTTVPELVTQSAHFGPENPIVEGVRGDALHLGDRVVRGI